MSKEYSITSLFDIDIQDQINNIDVINVLIDATREISLLNGTVRRLSNAFLIVETLGIQEAKASSEVENIFTTYDDLYTSNKNKNDFTSIEAKEVHRYADALKLGYDLIKKNNLLTINTIIEIQKCLEGNDAGFRARPGTSIVNDRTKEIVHIPPQNHEDIIKYMDDLVKFINDAPNDINPLIKMALIHYQFETIHPFYDGNGRTGRIINILYLVLVDLLNVPVLYLSRYINSNKGAYYRLLQDVRDNNNWKDWIIFILKGVTEISQETTTLVDNIMDLMRHHKQIMKKEAPKLYSHELINNLYKYPYTKIDFVQQDCQVSRSTAYRRLVELEKLGIVQSKKYGKEIFYINVDLLKLLSN